MRYGIVRDRIVECSSESNTMPAIGTAWAPAAGATTSSSEPRDTTHSQTKCRMSKRTLMGRKIRSRGGTTKDQAYGCHSERSEESPVRAEILRLAGSPLNDRYRRDSSARRLAS